MSLTPPEGPVERRGGAVVVGVQVEVLGASTCEEGDRHVPALVGDGDDPADHISGHDEEHHHSDGGSGAHLPGQSSGDLAVMGRAS